MKDCIVEFGKRRFLWARKLAVTENRPQSATLGKLGCIINKLEILHLQTMAALPKTSAQVKVLFDGLYKQTHNKIK